MLYYKLLKTKKENHTMKMFHGERSNKLVGPEPEQLPDGEIIPLGDQLATFLQYASYMDELRMEIEVADSVDDEKESRRLVEELMDVEVKANCTYFAAIREAEVRENEING